MQQWCTRKGRAWIDCIRCSYSCLKESVTVCNTKIISQLCTTSLTSHNLVVTTYRKIFVYNFMRGRNLVVLGKRNDDLSSLTLTCVLTEETVAYNCVSPEREVCLNTCGPLCYPYSTDARNS